MNSRPELRLDWCGYDAARYAVEHWHYSKTMPAGKTARLGVWENERFVGAVIFGTGAAPQAHCPYRIGRQEICELVRVALREHEAFVTRIVAIALRLVYRAFPRLRLIVSYADPEYGHLGGIYQAGNWLFVGKTSPCEHFETRTGQRIHSKTLRTGRRGFATKLLKAGDISQVWLWKYKYLYPLDSVMRAQIEPLRKPYPKRAGSIENDAPAIQQEEGGVIPTPALQEKGG